MKLERVGRVSVRHLCLEVGRQIDDVDGPKWTFLWTNTTSYTESFRNESNLGFWSNLDAQLASPYHWARPFAFLPAFLEATY